MTVEDVLAVTSAVNAALHTLSYTYVYNGALHTEPWIWIWCGSGILIQRPLFIPPHDLDPDPSYVQCCVGECVRSSPAVQCAQSLWYLELMRDHIESGLGIQIQWIWFQCPCGEPQCVPLVKRETTSKIIKWCVMDNFCCLVVHLVSKCGKHNPLNAYKTLSVIK